MTNNTLGKPTSKMAHKRRFGFKTQFSDLSEFDVCIFVNNYSLRSHVIKHFIKSGEWQKAWKHYENKDYYLKKMKEVRRYLNNIGCPGLAIQASAVLCSKCLLYQKKCNLLLEGWENHYVEIIKKVITYSIQHPLFANYYYNDDGKAIKHILIFLMEGHSIVVYCHKFIYKKDIFYNVRTAYCTSLTKEELIKREEKRALGSITYYTPITWGISRRIQTAEPQKEADEWQKKLDSMWSEMSHENNKN